MRGFLERSVQSGARRGRSSYGPGTHAVWAMPRQEVTGVSPALGSLQFGAQRDLEVQLFGSSCPIWLLFGVTHLIFPYLHKHSGKGN